MPSKRLLIQNRRNDDMRIILWAIVATCAVFAVGTDAATAAKYKWCTDGAGDNVQCYYKTYKQCMEDAAGTDADCSVNPRFTYSPHKRMKQVAY
jgi:hypothetical protein